MKRALFFLPFYLVAGLAGAAEPEPKTAEYAPAVRVEPLLQATVTANGMPIQYPKTDHPEVKMLLVEIPPGAETGWHKHPMPCYAYMLAGSVTVELESGKRNVFSAGQAFVETVDTLHNGKNNGTEAVRILMVITGEKGKPVAEPVKK
ncbi:MAG: cupin domain-containing protein [Verrucomicrobiota bacterium]